MAVETVPLTRAGTKSKFRCGVKELDDYLSRYALRHEKKGLSKTYLLCGDDSADEPKVLGYYSLSMATIDSARLKAAIQQSLPRYPIPVALIGRLAVHEECHGQGLGGKLLGDALERVLSVAELVGCYGVIVDAKDTGAEGFYLRYGFVTVTGGAWPRRMFLGLATILASQMERRPS